MVPFSFACKHAPARRVRVSAISHAIEARTLRPAPQRENVNFELERRSSESAANREEKSMNGWRHWPSATSYESTQTARAAATSLCVQPQRAREQAKAVMNWEQIRDTFGPPAGAPTDHNFLIKLW